MSEVSLYRLRDRAHVDRWLERPSSPTAVERGTHKTVKARTRQSRPDSGLGFQVKVLNTFQGVPSSLGSGLAQTLQLLRKNVKRFRGGLVFKAHRRVYHSTLRLRVIKKKQKKTLRRSTGA